MAVGKDRKGIESYASKMSAHRIPVERIEIVPGWNEGAGRYTPEKFEELKDSIRENGVREPIKGYNKDDKFILTDGENRVRAVLALIAEGVEIKSIPALTEDKTANEGERLLTQILSNSGVPFTKREQGRVMKRLLSYGWAIEDIARKTGFKVGYVNECLLIQGAEPAVVELLENKTVAESTVIHAIKTEGVDGALPVIQEAMEVAKSEGKDKVSERHVKQVQQKKTAVVLTPEEEAAKREDLLTQLAMTDWEAMDTATLEKVWKAISK